MLVNSGPRENKQTSKGFEYTTVNGWKGGVGKPFIVDLFVTFESNLTHLHLAKLRLESDVDVRYNMIFMTCPKKHDPEYNVQISIDNQSRVAICGVRNVKQCEKYIKSLVSYLNETLGIECTLTKKFVSFSFCGKFQSIPNIEVLAKNFPHSTLHPNAVTYRTMQMIKRTESIIIYKEGDFFAYGFPSKERFIDVIHEAGENVEKFQEGDSAETHKVVEILVQSCKS